jgi:hypothetical protein
MLGIDADRVIRAAKELWDRSNQTTVATVGTVCEAQNHEET